MCKFAALKMLFIILDIGLNLVFFVLLPYLYGKYPEAIATVYDPSVGAGYAFYINLVCTASITFLFYREFKVVSFSQFDKTVLRRLLAYGWPILVLGIAGILNQTADKILFPKLYHSSDSYSQLGIYGAASKIAMIMAMITQALRYAYEPYVFSKNKEKDSRETYAQAMKYFIIFTLLAFLFVIGYMDILKYIISSDYWEGLYVVPIVMAADIMMGIYFNLSFWYKLTDKTIWGAWFSGIGCAVLICVNVIFIPRYGYVACAWGGVAGYGTAMLLSYFVGQKKYPIRYPLRSIFTYIAIAAFFTCIITCTPHDWPLSVRLVINTGLLILFLAHLIYHDMPLKGWPVIGKYFRKG